MDSDEIDTERDESVASLLREAVDRFRVDPRREPDRAVAIVADLAARPGQSSMPTIPALRTTLRIAAVSGAGLTTRPRAECLAEATAAGVEPATAGHILDVLLAIPPGTEPIADPSTDDAVAGAPGNSAGSRRNALLIGFGAIALLAIGLLIVLGRSEPEPSATTTPAAQTADPTPTAVVSEIIPETDADENQSSSQPAVTGSSTVTAEPSVVDEPPATVAEPSVLVAEFAPARDGGFLVSREWRVSNGEITTTVVLENPGDQPISGVHREFPPPAPGADPATAVWQPPPSNLIATTAVFGQVSLAPGERFEITYRSPTSATDPTTQDVLDWYEAWRPQAEGLNSVLGTNAELPAPEIQTG